MSKYFEHLTRWSPPRAIYIRVLMFIHVYIIVEGNAFPLGLRNQRLAKHRIKHRIRIQSKLTPPPPVSLGFEVERGLWIDRLI